MNITYGSVCSGIEAASVAWEPLGMKPSWFSQFDPEHNYKRGTDFPSAVLAYHWPEVVNLGDMTKIAAAVRAGSVYAPMVLVGGTPCQAFSVAGARAGLSDPRGQLTISYVDLANAIDQQRAADGEKPAIIVWENVPGVLSDKGNAFGSFLGLLAGEDCELQPTGKKWSNAGCVYGPQRTVAWRILDAQYFGVAQRRRRVFVVASARTDFDPTKVLFELEGMRRDIAPSRSPNQVTPSASGSSTKVGSHWDSELNPHPTLNQSFNTGGIGASNQELFSQRGSGIIGAYRMTAFGEYADDESASTVKARDYKDATDLAVMSVHGTQDPDTNVELAHTLGRNHGQENGVLTYGFQPRIGRNGRGDMGDICHTLSAEAGETGKGDAAPCVAIGFNSKDHGQDAAVEIAPTLRAAGHTTSHANAGAPPAVAFAENSRAEVRLEGGDGQITGALSTGGGKPGQGYPTALIGLCVRRLTPVECERLQGFPDNHTLIPVSKRKQITADEYAYLRSHFPTMTAEEAYRQAADGPRYKAIGNSMAVPVMKWIGERIMMQMAEEKEPEKKNSDYGGSNTPVEIKDLWMTPPEIYAHLNAEFCFSVDLAASGLNKLHEKYITAEMNTLGIDWCGMFGRAWGWLNPPYSSIGPFIEKAIEQQERGFGTVMLVPADTSVGWFRLALTSVSEVRFIIGGRISFIRADTNTSVSGNNKGSMLLIFSPHKIGARHFGTVDRDKLMTPL